MRAGGSRGGDHIYIYIHICMLIMHETLSFFPVFEFSQFPTKESFIRPTRYSSIHHDALPEPVPAFVLGTKNMTSRPANTISSVQRSQLSSPTAVGTSDIKAFSFDKVGWEVITCYRSWYVYVQTNACNFQTQWNSYNNIQQQLYTAISIFMYI